MKNDLDYKKGHTILFTHCSHNVVIRLDRGLSYRYIHRGGGACTGFQPMTSSFQPQLEIPVIGVLTFFFSAVLICV